MLRHSKAARFVGAIALTAAAYALMGQYGGAPIWWVAGSGDRMPLSAFFENKTGDILVFNADGEALTKNHAFFDPMGTNGRACITCHQMSSGMSVSTDRLQERWTVTAGTDPVFAAVDGSDCPTLPQNDRASHNLLLNHGLFRIEQRWPAAGVTPEFTIEVLRDPTGCNTGSKYGLHAPQPTLSVYRRPRVVGNFKYLDGQSAFTADSRATTLEAQAIDAIQKHEQGSMTRVSAADLKQIVDFEKQIYVAQGIDATGGDLAEVGGPQGLSAWHLGLGKTPPADTGFLTVANWSSTVDLVPTNTKAAFRASVERGSKLFSSRSLDLRNTANLPASANGRGTCATCHSERMTGSNRTNAWMDIGTNEPTWAGDRKELPLFRITCNRDAQPHPQFGRVILTNDPGRALISGKCADVGSLVMQQLRALAARPPYFTAGSAQTLRDVVDFYDKRFSAHYTEQEKQDLTNFLRVL